MEIQEIWPRGGIQDLPSDWRELALPSMREVETRWRDRLASIHDSGTLAEFTQQLNREWAIETGQIENLYDIESGVTVTLIQQGFDAALIPHGATNKDPEYVVALLNDQQAALDWLFAFVKQDRPLTVSFIKELHAMMTESQISVTVSDHLGNRFEVPMIKGDWKTLPNFPRRNGTEFHYCPPEHTAAEMDRLVEMHSRHQEAGVAPEVESAWLHHRFSQIHPFQDGNGRIARALASLVMIRAGLFPVSISRDEKASYLDNLSHADAGDLRPLIYQIVRGQQSALRRAG